MRDKTAYLTGEQRFGEHIACVVDVFALGSIPDGQRHTCPWCAMQSQGYGFEGIVVPILYSREGDIGMMETCWQEEAQAVGIYPAFRVEYRNLVDSGVRGINIHRIAIQLTEVLDDAVTHDCQSQGVLSGKASGLV